VHPSGGEYKLLSGGLESIARITPAEQDALWSLAKTFDEMPERPQIPSHVPATTGTGPSDQGLLPGADFEQRTTWQDLLEPHGWIAVYRRGEEIWWRRPGKDTGWSATTGHVRGLKVFSTSTLFDPNRTYTKFAAFAVLQYGGDFSACAKALAGAGYGTRSSQAAPRCEKPNSQVAPRDGERNPLPAASQNGHVTVIETPPDQADQPLMFKDGHWKSCLRNSRIWLLGQSFGKPVRYDTFRQLIVVDGKPISDELILALKDQIEGETRTAWCGEHIREALITIADRSQFSSLAEWLGSLVWDGECRLNRFFTEAYGCVCTAYSIECARVLFISAVARAFQPGCQADIMVVLIGPQGVGKSMGIASLSPRAEWYADDLGCDLTEGKAGEGLQGKWLFEFSEFARINRSTLDTVKSFVSRRCDHYRPPYGRIARDFPRSCVFIGTTNDPHPLRDVENRRFMPIACTLGNIPWIEANRDQLWAESVHRFKQGDKWWVEGGTEVGRKCIDAQEEARMNDAWETILDEELFGRDRISMKDAAERLGVKPDRLDRATQTRIGIALIALGFTRKRESTGARSWYYERNQPVPPSDVQ
jgi:Virulence-associated protein E-like domain